MLGVLAPLASLLGLEVEAVREKLQRQMLFWGIAGTLGVVCVSFLLVAADNALAMFYGPVVAPLIIAGVALIAALVVWAVFDAMARSEKRRLAEEARKQQSAGFFTTATLAALPMLMKSPVLRQVGIPAAGALVAGLLLSRATAQLPEREP